MKYVFCLFLALIAFQVHGMKGFLLLGGGGGGYAATFKYEEKLNALSDHEELLQNSGLHSYRNTDVLFFYRMQELCKKIEKIVNFADSENVNYYDGQGRMILHWVAEYGTDSDFNTLIKIPGICPSFYDMRGKKPIDLVGQDKDSLKSALRSLEKDHHQCEYCSFKWPFIA